MTDQAARVLVVRPQGLRPDDEIVAVQTFGATDKVLPLREAIVKVGAGKHPVNALECIQLRRRSTDPEWYELNLWKGTEYFDETLFRIRRASCAR